MLTYIHTYIQLFATSPHNRQPHNKSLEAEWRVIHAAFKRNSWPAHIHMLQRQQAASHCCQCHVTTFCCRFLPPMLPCQHEATHHQHHRQPPQTPTDRRSRAILVLLPQMSSSTSCCMLLCVMPHSCWLWWQQRLMMTAMNAKAATATTARKPCAWNGNAARGDVGVSVAVN